MIDNKRRCYLAALLVGCCWSFSSGSFVRCSVYILLSGMEEILGRHRAPHQRGHGRNGSADRRFSTGGHFVRNALPFGHYCQKSALMAVLLSGRCVIWLLLVFIGGGIVGCSVSLWSVCLEENMKRCCMTGRVE